MAVTNLRVVCKIITCVSAFTEMAILIFLEIAREIKSCCRSGHSALQATRRMPLWALAIALATGKNTRLFGLLDQNETGFFTYVSQRAESKAATVATSGLAWVASWWQGTSRSSSFVSKVLGANYKRANKLHPVADKSPCALTGSNLST